MTGVAVPTSFSKIAALVIGNPDVADPRRRRTIGVVQGFLTGIANRFIGIAVSFLSVPLTIGYLGPERYGVWTLVGSILAWIALADLGIGNGLTNAVAAALGAERPDLVRSHVSTALVVLTLSSLVIGAGVALAWPFIDWAAIFNITTPIAKSETGPAMAAAIGIFLLGFPLSVVSRTYNGSQHGRLSNYWSAVGSLLSLGALLAVTRTSGGLLLLVLAISGTGLLVQLASGVWLFTRFKPEFAPRLNSVRASSVRQITVVGVQFFVLQVTSLTIFQTDNLLVAHFLGASNAPVYSVTYRLFNVIMLIQNLLMGYLWVAYAEAISRRDIEWVKKTFKKTMILSASLTFLSLIPMTALAKPFIRIWTRGAIDPPTDLVFWMAAWCLINSVCSPIACLLAAASHLKAQLVYGLVLSAANLFMSITLIPRWGVSGAIAGTVMCYLIFNCGPTMIDVWWLLKRLSRNGAAVAETAVTAPQLH